MVEVLALKRPPGMVTCKLRAQPSIPWQINGDNDVIVATTALERGSEAATFNQRHFAQVKGLAVIEPK